MANAALYLKNVGSYKYKSVSSSHPLNAVLGKGISTTYAEWNATDGSGGETYVFYRFDTSAVPADAEITSVHCDATVTLSDSLAGGSTIGLYYNQSKLRGTELSGLHSGSSRSFDGGKWTRAELNFCDLKIYGSRAGFVMSSPVRTFKFYGAVLTVEYTVPGGDAFLVKLGGAWTPVQKLYKKQSGVWVEQDSIEDNFSTEMSYLRAR